MNKSIWALVFTMFFMAGCVTLPEIKDDLLVDKTADEDKNLNSIAQETIALNQENNKIKESNKMTLQRIVISDKLVAAYDKFSEYIKAKEAMYTSVNDRKKLESAQMERQKNEEMIKQENLNLICLKAKDDYEKAGIDLKNAEVAASLAKLNLEKAKIARKYQDKNTTVKPADPKEAAQQDKNKVDVTAYEKQYNSQNDSIPGKKEKLKKAADVYNQALAKLKESGYKIEE
jgi:hypothetical protein